MSDPINTTPKLPKVPDIIQGAPVIMTFVRQAIGYAATAGALAMIGFLDAKGYKADWLAGYLPWIIGFALIAILTFVWSLVASNAKANQIVLLIEKVLEAAQTGTVAPEVHAIAPPQMKPLIAAVQNDPQKKL